MGYESPLSERPNRQHDRNGRITSIENYAETASGPSFMHVAAEAASDILVLRHAQGRSRLATNA